MEKKKEFINHIMIMVDDNSKRDNLSLTNSLGQLHEEINYIDDKKNGIYKSYFVNGQLCEEVNYINNIKVEN